MLRQLYFKSMSLKALVLVTVCGSFDLKSQTRLESSCVLFAKKHSLRLIEHTFCKKFSNLFKSMVILLKCITKLEGLKTCPLARPLCGMYPSVKQFQSSCKMQFLLTNKNFVPTTKFLIWQEGNPKILDCDICLKHKVNNCIQFNTHLGAESQCWIDSLS